MNILHEAFQFLKYELTMAGAGDDGWNNLVHIAGTVWETCK